VNSDSATPGVVNPTLAASGSSSVDLFGAPEPADGKKSPNWG
jgi:hypothetical protein